MGLAWLKPRTLFGKIVIGYLLIIFLMKPSSAGWFLVLAAYVGTKLMSVARNARHRREGSALHARGYRLQKVTFDCTSCKNGRRLSGVYGQWEDCGCRNGVVTSHRWVHVDTGHMLKN